MIYLVLSGLAGLASGVVSYAVTWVVVANRNDRGLATGPLPVQPQPDPPWLQPGGADTQPLPVGDLVETGGPRSHRAP